MNCISFVSLALAAIAAEPLAAQGPQTDQAAPPPAVELTIGPSTSWGGRYYNREGVAGELTFTFDHKSTPFAAFTVGAQGYPDLARERCLVPPPSGTSTSVFGCAKTGPAIAHVGVLFGLERSNSSNVIRAMAGPAYFSGDGNAFGGQIQVDAATVVATHIAIELAARGGGVARDGEVLRLFSMNVGLRVH
jgi:hypothetical protein